jgi:hypothetical protein
LAKFEKKFWEEMEKYKTDPEKKQASIELMEHFWNTEYKQIEAIESEMILKTESVAKKYHFWSIFNPVTFYISVNNENSSRGYMSYLAFYRDMQKMQRRFLRFYIDKRFHENSTKVVPFLKDDEYIYKLKSSLPAYFLEGIVFCVFIIALLLFMSYRLLKKRLSPPEKKKRFSQLALDFKRGKHFVYRYKDFDPSFPEQLLNVLMGKIKEFTGKFLINGKSIVTGEKKNFVYLPDPHLLPAGTKVKAMIEKYARLQKIPKSDIKKLEKEFDSILGKRFWEIDEVQKVNLMLGIVAFKKADIYLFNNFLIHIDSMQVLEEIIGRIKRTNILIIETDSTHVYHEKFDRYCMISIPDGRKYKETKIH